MKYKTALTQEELKKLLDYNPSNGEFKWRNPTHHYLSYRSAGNMKNGWYTRININGEIYLAHRLAWLYTYGVWPSEIDHINRNKADNRIINLREVKRSTNMANSENRSNNTSGFKGVTFDRGKWQAQIVYEGKRYNLGRFSSAEDAGKAYKAKLVELCQFTKEV